MDSTTVVMLRTLADIVERSWWSTSQTAGEAAKAIAMMIRNMVNESLSATENSRNFQKMEVSSTDPQNVCFWSQDNVRDEDGTWNTNCGKMFTLYDGIPSENNMKFCYHCGRVLIEIIQVEEDET